MGVGDALEGRVTEHRLHVVEQAGDKLDGILVPKVGKASELEFVALLLSQIEAAKGLEKISLSALIETPNFDRVAREGVLFTNALVPAPSCTPRSASPSASWATSTARWSS